jgi:hypothetical protein
MGAGSQKQAQEVRNQMGLTATQMASLLATKGDTSPMALVNGVWESSKITRDTVGAHEGRAGTMKRNRRGVSTRMANGSRYYNDVEATVQAYLAPRVVR